MNDLSDLLKQAKRDLSPEDYEKLKAHTRQYSDDAGYLDYFELSEKLAEKQQVNLQDWIKGVTPLINGMQRRR
jgi:hypothetical protein